MKKRYKYLLSVFIIEFIIVSILNERNISVKSWLGNAIGIIIFFLPLLILFFQLGRDEKLTEGKRLCFKIAFWFIIICYLLGCTITLLLN